MYNLDPATNKYSFFTADVKADFHVGEDMFIWRRQKSQFGGLFQSDEQSIERRPHMLSVDDVEVLMTFFDIIALKKFRTFLAPINTASHFLF